MNKIALCLIVKGTDEEATLLNRCLENMAPHVDGIFITRTHLKGETPNAAVGNVARLFNATLSDFEWIYDFSAARNFNFAQVTPEFDYILWSDADDIWRGLEKLKKTIKKHDTVDAFAFWYSYDWDDFRKPIVVHKKTMLVKNEACAKWVGALHEDLEPLRQLNVMLLEGIERLHITNKDRTTANAQRNVEIAKREAKLKPDDPRSYWNLANSQFGVADYESARRSYEEFLETSDSQDEKYLGYMRLADVYKSLGRMSEAVKHMQIAIGMAQELPDAYLQLGYYYFSMSDWDKAEKSILDGIVRKPQKNKMIVFNPRDYDYNPLMLLAQVYSQKNRPHNMLTCLEGCLRIYPNDPKLKKLVEEGKKEKEEMARALTQVKKLQKIKNVKKLRAALDALPDDIKSHPAVAVLRNENFVKTESSGKDLVIYCGTTTQMWNPETFKTEGIGGSEENVIHNARELAHLGWNVTVYNNCGHKEIISEGVTYKPFWEFNHRDKQDVIIIWRSPKAVDYDLNADRIYIDLHDVIPQGEFTPKRLDKITKVFVKTKFHRSLFPNVPDEKICIIPNGMDIKTHPHYKKEQKLIINTSSPDRSLDALVPIFKKIKEKVPNARCQWAYGWDGFKNAHSGDMKKMKWMEETIAAMEEAGIESLGRLTQKEVADLYAKANVFLYPTEFAEIDCISVKKAQASGCVAVTTDFGALKETNRFGVTVHSKKTKDDWNRPYQFHFGIESEYDMQAFAEIVTSEITLGVSKPNLEEVAKWAKGFEWSATASRINEILNEPSGATAEVARRKPGTVQRRSKGVSAQASAD